MAINKRFVHFKKKESFQRELNAGNILNTSIVFIADSKQIYVNGSFFSENTLFDLNELLANVSGNIEATDTTNEAVVKLYKELNSVLDGDAQVIKDMVKRSEMGTPEGVATLDNFGLVPIDQLFLKQADFYQFQDIAVIFDGTLTGKGQIIFNTRSNKFVINQRGNGIFTNWDNADEYGTASPEGRIPFPGKIYNCELDGKSYIWNDTTLVETEIDESRIRPPYGIVKLDENYLVPYDQLPVEVYGELEFGDIINNPPDLVESGSAPQNPKFKDIIYCGMLSVFICRFQEPGTENYKWYKNWPTAEMYGELTSNGIRPSIGVTYLDGQRHYLYQFNGHNLVKGDYIGTKRPVYSAIQGEQLDEKVNENLAKIEENTLQISNARNDITNLINSKADKTELSNVIGEEESDPILEEIDTTGVDKIKEILVTGSEDLYIADSKLALTTNERFTIKGYYLGKLGRISKASSDVTGVTPLLPLNKTYPIVLKNVIAFNTAVAVCFYDAAGSFISYPDGIEDLHGDFTVSVDKYPANACYFRACSEKAGSTYTNGPTQEAREGAFVEALQTKQPAITPSDDIAPLGADKLALTDRGKHEAFDTLWLNLCGSNGNIDYTHIEDGNVKPYLLNGIYLTRLEAMRIVMQCRTWGAPIEDFTINNIVTNIPGLTGASSRQYSNSFSNLRVVNMAGILPTLLEVCLNGSKLISILNFNALYLTRVVNSFKAPALVTLDISGLKISLDLSKCPLINLTSWQGIVSRAANTDTITITVHPDVYAKLTGDTTNSAAAALTASELAAWKQVVTDAAAKKISFATI